MTKRHALNNATTWLLMIFDTDLPAPSKLVAAYLRTHMNDYRDFAFPSVPTIAEKTSQSQRTVQGHLRGLCAAGFLRENGFSEYGTKVYKIVLPPQEMHPAGGAPPAGDAPAGDAPPQEMPERGAGAAPEVTNKTNISIGEPPEDINPVAWQHWITHKFEKGTQLTFSEVTLTWGMLRKHDFDTQQQIIEYSIRNGYTGLFEPKGKRNANTNSNHGAGEDTRRLSPSERVSRARDVSG